MSKELDLESFAEDFASRPAPSIAAPEVSPEASSEVESASGEAADQQSSVSDRPMLSATELGSRHGVSDRTVNQWFKDVVAAYFWLPEESLKVGRSAQTRYTALCQDLIADLAQFKADGGKAEDWIALVHSDPANAEAIAAFKSAEAAAEQPPTLPQPEDAPTPAEVMPHSLHGAAMGYALPPGGAMVPASQSVMTGLERLQAQLKQMEQAEQLVVTGMVRTASGLSQNLSLWQQTQELSQQLVQRQGALSGAQLGIVYVEAQQSAFLQTVQNLNTGVVPTPGKQEPEEAAA